MRIVHATDEARSVRYAGGGLTWGLVPTMGALHEGHLSLVRAARAECHQVAVSIFVNPLQFNNPEDLKSYPLSLERDTDLLRAEQVDLVWAPSAEEMYPPGFQTHVEPGRLASPLEGASRPGHFRGVATVVAKLFNVLLPDRAYFGQKDAQQAAVIRQMVHDLAFDIAIITCPTVREPEGLALSSRNRRLSQAGRQAAAVLYRALTAARISWGGTSRQADYLRAQMRAVLDAEPLAQIDYISVADPDTLEEIQGEARRALLSLAVYIENVRLIDNLLLD